MVQSGLGLRLPKPAARVQIPAVAFILAPARGGRTQRRKTSLFLCELGAQLLHVPGEALDALFHELSDEGLILSLLSLQPSELFFELVDPFDLQSTSSL